MMNPDLCRAARALINWSQHQLAAAARVGVSTVKNFETGRTAPTLNNLQSMKSVLEAAGVEFVPEEDGGPGVLLRRLRLRAYIPGEGLHLEARYADLALEAPDNDFVLWFKISDAALAFLAEHPIANEIDARVVARTNEARLIEVLKRKLKKSGLLSPGGRPREITHHDLRKFGR